ncbi:MAG: amidohydrolase family protein [Ilumatobacteraceae bacterium]
MHKPSVLSIAHDSSFTIQAARLITPHRPTAPAVVEVRDGVVTSIRLPGHHDPPVGQLIDWPGTITAGMVDAQVNGGLGFDLVTADPSGWRDVATNLLHHGVTAFCPTAVTAPIDSLVRFAEAGNTFATNTLTGQSSCGSAHVLRIHLEGPIIAATRAGAHDQTWLADDITEIAARLADIATRIPLMITLAPELDGGQAAIATLTAAGAIVSVGHSDATAADVHAAAAAGATWVTHLYNAQRPLHHREPGVVGAALVDPRLTCGLIVDRVHLADDAERLAFAAATGRIALVSDAVAAAGMPPGNYRIGPVTARLGTSGPPRLTDGTLAGSALFLDEAVRNCIKIGLDPATAVTAATAVPATALRRHDIGQVKVGCQADLLGWDDDWIVCAVWQPRARVPN